MIPFDEKYAAAADSIRKDAGLVRALYAAAKRQGLVRYRASLGEERKKSYFTGWSNNGMHLGLDLGENNNLAHFPKIMANMRIIYEASEGKADLLKAYVRLADEKGIVSEDVTQGGVIQLWDWTPYHKLDPVLNEVFAGEAHSELERTTFLLKEQDWTRKVIADLNHVEPKPKLQALFNKYRDQYWADRRFLLEL